MMAKQTVHLKTLLSVIVLFGPSFLGLSLDAFSILPVVSMTNYVTFQGAFSSSPFSSPASIGNSLQRQFHGMDGIKNSQSTTSTTNLSMYNLPPGGGGGGGGGKNEIADIAKGAFSILLTVAFFASPLGGLVLGIFNSFLVLAFVLPLVATVGFQVWQKVNTVQGPCPACGAPTTVMKSKNDSSVVDGTLSPQSMCFNCGAILQANEDNTGIDNVSGRKTIDDLNAPMGGGSSIFDMFSNVAATDEWSTATPTTEKTSTSNVDKAPKIEKDAIIDVDVLD